MAFIGACEQPLVQNHEIYGEPDVVIKVFDTKFASHRIALASCSPYFEAMFSQNFAEKDKKEIEIQDVEPDAMKTLINSIRDGKEALSGLKCNELLSVLQASSMLQFDSLQNECKDVIVHKWLTPSNCLPIMSHADALNIALLYEKARAQALWEFSEVKLTPSFLNLTIEQLEGYLKEDGLNAVKGEMEVFEAGFSWLENPDAEDREQYILRVLKCIRFSSISASDIRTIVLCTSMTGDQDITRVLQFILAAKDKASKDALQETTTNGNTHLHFLDTAGTEANSTKSDNNVLDKADVVAISRQLLFSPPRALPLIPCVVGQCFSPPKPYIIAFKDNKLVPLVRLVKAEQAGCIEPNGYRVINRGMNLFILGGEFMWGHSNWNKSVWRYNQSSETWSYETSLEHQCRHQSVCCLDNDIYVMGGFGKYRVISDVVNKYNLETKSWTRCSPLPSPIYSAASCVYKKCLYVFGPQVWSYNPERNNWITIASLCYTFNSAMPYGDFVYLTSIYSNELTMFDGNKTPDDTLSFKVVGHFKSNATNTCLVQDIIYVFAIDLDKCLQVESYNIKTNKFQVLWSCMQSDDPLNVNFSGSSTIGCFSILDY